MGLSCSQCFSLGYGERQAHSNTHIEFFLSSELLESVACVQDQHLVKDHLR